MQHFVPSSRAVVEDVVAELTFRPKKVGAKRPVYFFIALKERQTGAPITTLQPYLGALGHLVGISRDGKRYVHTHPEKGSYGHHSKGLGALQGNIIFFASFPAPGEYMLFAEFNVKGRILTFPFAIQVK
jgi:hypothetical protein